LIGAPAKQQQSSEQRQMEDYKQISARLIRQRSKAWQDLPLATAHRIQLVSEQKAQGQREHKFSHRTHPLHAIAFASTDVSRRRCAGRLQGIIDGLLEKPDQI